MERSGQQYRRRPTSLRESMHNRIIAFTSHCCHSQGHTRHRRHVTPSAGLPAQTLTVQEEARQAVTIARYLRKSKAYEIPADWRRPAHWDHSSTSSRGTAETNTTPLGAERSGAERDGAASPPPLADLGIGTAQQKGAQSDVEEDWMNNPADWIAPEKHPQRPFEDEDDEEEEEENEEAGTDEEHPSPKPNEDGHGPETGEMTGMYSITYTTVTQIEADFSMVQNDHSL